VFRIVKEINNIQKDCPLQVPSRPGSFLKCLATGDMCKNDGGGICPFDHDDVVQIEYRNNNG